MNKEGKAKIYLRLIHKRKKYTFPLNFYVDAKFFDFGTFRCTKGHPNYQKYNFRLQEAVFNAEEVLLDLSSRKTDEKELCARIEAALTLGPNSDQIRPFVEKLVSSQKQIGRSGNAKTYETALAQLENWLQREARWTDFTYQKLGDFKVYKLAAGIKPNSVAAYLRTFRVWVNEAIKMGLFPKDSYPFQRGLMPQRQRTIRRNVQSNVITKIWNERKSFSGSKRLALNTILLQFLLQGADFIEVARLKKSDIKDGYISFTRYKNRSKGNQQPVFVKITKEIETIISESSNDFLVPVVSIDKIEDNHTLFETKRRNFRRSLSEALTDLGIEELTSKGIRHTWATIAASLGVHEEIRELAMGHTSTGMQAIYTQLEQSKVDEANQRVIDLVIGGKTIVIV